MAGTSPEQNPYHYHPLPDTVAPLQASADATMPFAGSMTIDEGHQVEELLTGRKNGGTATYWQLVGILAATASLFGGFICDAIYFDELDQLLEFGLGAVVVGALLVAGLLHKWHQTARFQSLQENLKGIFSILVGRVTSDGIDFLVGDVPMSYRWKDFVGAKLSDDAVVLFVDDPNERNWLARSMFTNPGDWKRVRTLIEQSVPKLGRLPRRSLRQSSLRMVHIAAGTRALDAQDWNAAITEFNKALALDPQDAQALRGRMVAAVGLEDVDLAWRAIGDVVNNGCEDELTRRLRSRVLIARAEYEAALPDLNWLLERTPDDSNVLRDRGLVSFKLGKFEQALQDASAAVEFDPNDFIALNNRGAALLEIGRRDEAIQSLEAAVTMAPEFERPRELLAMAMSAET